MIRELFMDALFPLYTAPSTWRLLGFLKADGERIKISSKALITLIVLISFWSTKNPI